MKLLDNEAKAYVKERLGEYAQKGTHKVMMDGYALLVGNEIHCREYTTMMNGLREHCHIFYCDEKGVVLAQLKGFEVTRVLNSIDAAHPPTDLLAVLSNLRSVAEAGHTSQVERSTAHKYVHLLDNSEVFVKFANLARRVEEFKNGKGPTKPIPDRYNVGGFDLMEVMRAKLAPDEYKGFLKACIIKYAFRAAHKGQEAEDYAKLEDYARRLREFEQEAKANL